ncbi:MAG: LytR C-terminal domain-containing protein [Mycobacterium sp.]
MNERVPDSSGLPLRAMVMVLLFLGVVFLLVGFQALGSGGDDDDTATGPTVTTTTSAAPATTSKSPEPDVPRPEVRVFNISEAPGAAEGTADRLRTDGWTVAETGNLVLPGVPVTTVYFGEGEQEAADELGRLLEAPVEPRIPEVAELPPGLIVVVTG